MGPKVTISADEDVKFLLTIIKQLDGTVSLPPFPICPRDVQPAGVGPAHCATPTIVSMDLRKVALKVHSLTLT